MKKLFIYYTLIFAIIFVSCNQPQDKTSVKKTGKKQASTIEIPDFNADSAYKFIENQVSFGPRVPNTPEHLATAKFLAKKLSSYADTVMTQSFQARAYDGTILNGKNIIGSFKPSNKNRIMLCAHWDTRPFADHDPEIKNQQIPIDGANDGGSGVGVLLEIARQIQLKQPNIGLDIIFFDLEDFGPPQDHQKRGSGNWWALGSQYWAKNPHTYDYLPKFAILLDMVGGHDAKFYMEGYSLTYAPGILKNVWNTANRIGYGNYFIFEQLGYIDDDHKAINEILKIPAIDIIHLDNASSNGTFFEHWHTVHDDMDAIDKESLKVVGQTLLTVLYEQK